MKLQRLGIYRYDRYQKYNLGKRNLTPPRVTMQPLKAPGFLSPRMDLGELG